MVELVGLLDLDGIKLDFDYPGKDYRFVTEILCDSEKLTPNPI